MMNATWAWARLDFRRRWKSLVVLALLVAVTSGTVITTVSGALRGGSALDRLVEATDASDAEVDTLKYGVDWSPLLDLPYVEAIGPNISGGLLQEIDAGPADGIVFVPVDDQLTRTIDKPVVIEGRMFDPGADDEVVVTPQWAREHDVKVGDTVELVLDDPRGIGNGDGAQLPDAKPLPVDVTVVGLIRSALWADWPASTGSIIPSPGLATTYEQNYFGTGGRENPKNSVGVVVRLTDHDVDRFRKDAPRVMGDDELNIIDHHADRKWWGEAVAFENWVLGMFGLAVALASVLLVGTAVIRYTSAAASELSTARALGMTPRGIAASAATTPMIAGAVGVVLGAGGAIYASRWFPIGTAWRLEPDPGITANWAVLGTVGASSMAVITVAALMAARWVLRTSGQAKRRPSAAAVLVAQLGLPVPTLVGTRFALEPGRGATAVPVRPALVGSTIGVAGIVAALVFGAGISDVVKHPERLGQTYEIGAFLGFEGNQLADPQHVAAIIGDIEGVTQTAPFRLNFATAPEGKGSVGVLSVPDNVQTVVLEGRLPAGDDEILIAARTLTDLDREVGDDVVLTGSKGKRTFTIVGSGLVPAAPPEGRNDRGAFVTSQGFDSLFSSWDFSLMWVGTDGSVPVNRLLGTLRDATVKELPHVAGPDTFPFIPLRNDTVVEQMRSIENLPQFLAVFLAIVGATAIGHSLVTAVRRRRTELGTLRAVGTTPRGSATIVGVHSLVTATFGLLFGSLLGYALGQAMWRTVAGSVPTDYVRPGAALPMAIVISATVGLALFVAAVPAWRAARLRVADILRTE